MPNRGNAEQTERKSCFQGHQNMVLRLRSMPQLLRRGEFQAPPDASSCAQEGVRSGQKRFPTRKCRRANGLNHWSHRPQPCPTAPSALPKARTDRRQNLPRSPLSASQFQAFQPACALLQGWYAPLLPSLQPCQSSQHQQAYLANRIRAPIRRKCSRLREQAYRFRRRPQAPNYRTRAPERTLS